MGRRNKFAPGSYVVIVADTDKPIRHGWTQEMRDAKKAGTRCIVSEWVRSEASYPNDGVSYGDSYTIEIPLDGDVYHGDVYYCNLPASALALYHPIWLK